MLRIKLNIRTQPALIGVETKLARAPVRTELAPFSIDKTASTLAIDTELAKIKLDSDAGWAELGLAQPMELNRRLRDQSWRDAAFGTERAVAEGDRLAAFWEPGNTVEGLAAEDIPVPPFALFSRPARAVVVEVRPGEIRIDYRRGSAAVRLGDKPDPRPYEAGFVQVYLRQQAAMEITWPRLDVLA